MHCSNKRQLACLLAYTVIQL